MRVLLNSFSITAVWCAFIAVRGDDRCSSADQYLGNWTGGKELLMLMEAGSCRVWQTDLAFVNSSKQHWLSRCHGNPQAAHAADEPDAPGEDAAANDAAASEADVEAVASKAHRVSWLSFNIL